jgi:hypothetical protein
VPGRPAPTAPPIEGLPVGSTLVSLANATTATSDPEAAPPLSALAPAGEQPAMSPERARFTAERDGYMAQTRARVEACWRALPGAGEIEFMYTLRAASLTGETEVTPSIETELGHDSPVNIVESSLTPEQNRAALDCMLDAVDGTSFRTVLPSPELGTLVVLHQRWRVGAVPARP